MAIQIPNPGTGNGATGDNEFVLWSKVKANFEDQTNAASRTIGVGTGEVPVMSNDGIGGFGMGSNNVFKIPDMYQNLATGIYGGNGGASINFPEDGSLAKYGALLKVKRYNESINFTFGNYGAEVTRYSHDTNSVVGETLRFLTHKNSNFIYNATTALGANLVVDSTGKIMRSTSSERYKDIIADLELDDTAYENAMQLAPIVYRSTAEADNPNYHYYSFSAEALGAYDPAFTLWRDTETVTDDEGSTSEQPLDERQAEGINLNAIVAFLHATNVKQGKLIAEQAKAIETLTKRIDDITVE